jgi:3-hydroxybutyrate dehydrogenase
MLEGKSAIVTGSTSGIGLGIARALRAQGANILLNGFGDAAQIEGLCKEIASPPRISYTAAEVTKYGFVEGARIEGLRRGVNVGPVKVGYSAADISKPAEVAGMVEQATREFGRVDILVNNAGIQHTASVEKFPHDEWDSIIAINLSANFHAIKAVLPQMKQRNWGRIINIASTHGRVASIHEAAYVAAKHGVLGLTKVVTQETASTGITCNAICPEWVSAPLVQKQIDDIAARDKISGEQARVRLLAEKQPSLDFATPKQIGALVAFLCSEHAALIRGMVLPVDGAWTAQ